MNIFKSIFKFLETQELPPPIPDDRNTHIKLPNGSIYTGKIINGKLQGRGTLVYENGERYEGEFHEGMKHGKGKYYYIRGQLYIGDWFQNKKHGKGQYFYENGQRYKGEFRNNMKHGEGILFEEDGSEYKGTFANNKKHGEGQYFDESNNTRYQQTYENGRLVHEEKILQQEKYNSVSLQSVDEKPDPKQTSPKNKIPHSMKNFNQIRQSSSNSMELNSHQIILNSEMAVYSPALMQIQESQQKVQRHNKLNTFIFNNNKHVYIWTEDDVCNWLQVVGFLDYIDSFYKEKIDGLALLLLTEQDLKQLGVVIGDKKDMVKQIQYLKLIFRKQSVVDYQALKSKDFKSFNEIKIAFKRKVSSSSSSAQSDEQFQDTKLLRQQSNTSSKLQRKVYEYLRKHGIKLNFLIPKDQITIIKQIGKGGFGQVYLGRWLSQEVAVKKYVKKQGLRNRHIGHFIQQVQLINKLLHPSIVLYMGMCIQDNQYAMITEFLSNGSLFDYLHENPRQSKDLNDQKIFYIVKDVALGMTYLHGKKVMHCDMKSSNILIDCNWNVKLCDFGLSRINQPSSGDVKRVGTPHWMAPEILRGQKYSFGSDVYSFGMIIWELLAQEIPYKKYSAAQIIGMVGRDQKHEIATPKIDNPMMIELMKMCTKRNPAQRPTFSEIVQYLQKHEAMYLNLLEKI